MSATMTAKDAKAALKAIKAASFATIRGGVGVFVPLAGLPGLEQLQVSFRKVQTRLGYVAHEFVLLGPGGRRSPQREGNMMDRLVCDARFGTLGTRSDVAYLLGEGADLNEAARIVAARNAAASAAVV